MHWYLVHTKPKQETCALENLRRQGYACYLPRIRSEKLRQGVVMVVDQPLFPRYLFIRLGQGGSSPSWAPIRSTRGVSRLVSFGLKPAKVPDSLVEVLRARETSAHSVPERLFKQGDRVRLSRAPFAGIEAVYQMADGDRRVIVLIEILSKPVAVPVPAASLRKAS